MTQIKTLKFLKFNQKHDNRKLAELNKILPILDSEELKAWKTFQSLNGDIKTMAKEYQNYTQKQTNKEL